MKRELDSDITQEHMHKGSTHNFASSLSLLQGVQRKRGGKIQKRHTPATINIVFILWPN